MTTKVRTMQADIETINNRLSSGTGNRNYSGNILDGLSNGIATGFNGDALIPEAAAATFAPVRKVATSAGAGIGTTVNYWFQKHPLRLRVSSTTADAVPVTSGLCNTITQNTSARGVLRMAMADVDAAAQMLLDQGGLKPLPCGSLTAWDVAYHVCNVTNGQLAASLGFADIGVLGGAVSADPTAVANAAGVIFKITAGRINLYSIATTASLIGGRNLPSTDFVLRFMFNPAARQISAFIDGDFVGAYALPAAVTEMEVGARVCHLAAYTALTANHDPIGVDFDSLIVNVPVQVV